MLRFSQDKIKIPHGHADAKLFAHMSLILTIGVAAFASMFPLIIEQKLGAQNVGFYYGVISSICILASLVSTVIFKHISKVRIARTVLGSATIIIFMMNYAATIWHLGFLDVLRAICVMFSYISLMLFVREYSKSKELHESEGRYYLFFNIGWLIGPLIGGYLAHIFNKEAVFNFVSSCMLATLVYFELHGVRAKHPHITGKTETESLSLLWKSVKEFFKQPKLRKVFGVSFGLNFWTSMRAIYMPIAIFTYGFNEQTVGLLMALGYLPFILIERYIVRLAHKNGVRTYIVAGFWYLACFVSLFYLLRDYPWYVATLFVCANVGAAMIEPLKDVYYFEVVKKSETEHLWGIYNIAEYGAYLTAPLIISIFLKFAGNINYVWALGACFMVVFSLASLTIEKKAKK